MPALCRTVEIAFNNTIIHDILPSLALFRKSTARGVDDSPGDNCMSCNSMRSGVPRQVHMYPI
jgi:hypothetical protein